MKELNWKSLFLSFPSYSTKVPPSWSDFDWKCLKLHFQNSKARIRQRLKFITFTHSMPKFSQKEMSLLKLVSPHFPHLMLSHQGRNIFSASEWLIIPDMRVVPSIAMMSELCYYFFNDNILKKAMQVCCLGLLETASSARRHW